MISGQGYKEYSVMIKGLTKKQQKELENDKSMSLTMFSGQIDFDALEDPTKGLYISGAFMIIPNMISVFAITVSLLLMLF